MHHPHRAGLWICLAVLACPMVQLIVYAVFVEVVLPGVSLGLPLIGLWLLLAVVMGATVVNLGSALRRARPSFRWFGLGLLVLIGVSQAGFGYWQTTLDFPNAISPEERARMQANCRQELPWLLAFAALNMVAGSLLFLPPVGRFLRAQETSGPNEPLHPTGPA